MFNLTGTGASSGVGSYGGGTKGVTFAVSSTTNTTSATTSVTFPRSTKPVKLIASVSGGGTANITVQGLGAEMYAGSISANVPLVLPLAGLPEGTSLTISYQIFVTNTTTATYVNGTVFYV